MIHIARSYVDPSVMTYTIQAVAALAVALSAVFGVAFRRTRKVIFRLLHIDENAGRTVEPDIHRINPSEKPAADRAAEQLLAAVKGRHEASAANGYKPKVLQRVIAALFASALLVFTLFVVAPYEIVAGNESSLTFGLMQVWRVFVAPAILATLALTVVLTLLRGRAYNVVLMLVFGFALASYVQTMLLNGTLPSSDGAVVDWSNLTKVACGTLVAWVIVFILPLELSRLNRDLARRVVVAVSAVLIVVQAVGIGSLFVERSGVARGADTVVEIDERPMFVTERGMLSVAPENNIIVFVLDMYDTSIDLMPAVEQNPDLLDEMTGFTWFQNATAVITPTRDAVPAMLTGLEPSHDMTSYEYTASRWERATFLTDLNDCGYDIGLYSDILPTDIPYIRDNADNVLPVEDETGRMLSLNERGVLSALYECAMFRDLPWALKPFFWFYTDDVNNAMVTQTPYVGESTDEWGARIPYTTDDPLFWQKLRENGLSIVDEGQTGSFRFIHLMGPHYPYTMDEQGNRVDSTTRYAQSVGSMNIVSDYLRQLKELGVYDDAMIIITSDHGYFTSDDPFSLVDNAETPILLVKPPQSHEEAQAPLVISQMPVSNSDVMPTALSVVPGVSQTGDGINVLAADDPNRVRYFCLLNKDMEGAEHGLVEYEIVGDATDLNNWHPTGWVMLYPEGEWTQMEF